MPGELALQGFDFARAYSADPERSAALLETLEFERRDDGWEARGSSRGGTWHYDEPPAERGLAGRRHRAPHRLGLGDGRAPRLARAGDRGRRPPDAR